MQVEYAKNLAFTSYALIGDGRLSKNLQCYFTQLNLPFSLWARARHTQAELANHLEMASHILLCVHDSALADWATRLPINKVRVHFSGSLVVENVIGCHPLMTFTHQTHALDWYQKIPFILDSGVRLREALPGLSNPEFTIRPELKSFYHALCSLSGNSTYLLCRRVIEIFDAELGLPSEALTPFLRQVVENALHQDYSGLTGPVARGDWAVVQQHLSALENLPDLRKSYKSYLQMAVTKGLRVPEALL